MDGRRPATTNSVVPMAKLPRSSETRVAYMRGLRRQPSPAMARRKAASVSELTWCSMPSASIRAVSALTPSERRKASTVWWRVAALVGDARGRPR